MTAVHKSGYQRIDLEQHMELVRKNKRQAQELQRLMQALKDLSALPLETEAGKVQQLAQKAYNQAINRALPKE